MKIWLQALVLLQAVYLPAAAAALQVTCRFDVECFEAEACDAAAFEITLRPGDTDGRMILRSVAETIAGDVITRGGGIRVWQAVTDSSVQVLTWSDRAARYSVHLTDGPALVSYHGLCEDAP